MIAKRALSGLLSLFILISAVFVFARLTGDPGKLFLPLNASQESIDAFNIANGFDRPLWEQYVRFLGDMLRLDFGMSLRRNLPALTIVLQNYMTTLKLVGITVVVAFLAGAFIGCLAAFNVGGIFDRLASVISVAVASVPDFWLGLMAILLFSVTLGWLPTSGMATPAHWVIPVALLSLRPLGSFVQVIRGSMIATLSSPYIDAARGRGIPPTRIIFLHALRNAVIPALTVLAAQAAGILNGAVVVETIFGFTGIGQLLITGVLQRDFAVVQAAVFVIAVAIFTLNLLVDILYGVIDPRARSL
jgi:peptide/nickel transport system permease protein